VREWCREGAVTWRRESRFYGDPANVVDELRARGEREAKQKLRERDKKHRRIASLVKLAKEGKLHGR